MADTQGSKPGRSTRSTLQADLAVLGVAVVWGASYPVTKGALFYAPVLVLIFYRFGITACLMGAISRRELMSASRADLLRAVLLGGILSAIFLAEISGVAMTSATNTALLISLSTLLTPFLDDGLSRRLPPRMIVVGAGLGCLGVLLLAGGLTALSTGDALVLLAACLRAVMVVATKRLMAGRTLSSAALTATQAAVVSLLTLVLLSATLGPGALAVEADPRFWTSVVFLALFCTVAAFFIQNAAVRRTSPTRVGFLMGTEPLFGFALAHLMLSEPIAPSTQLGAVLIVGGTFLGLAAERRRPAPRV